MVAAMMCTDERRDMDGDAKCRLMRSEFGQFQKISRTAIQARSEEARLAARKPQTAALRCFAQGTTGLHWSQLERSTDCLMTMSEEGRITITKAKHGDRDESEIDSAADSH